MSLLSHAGNGIVKVTWPWCDVEAESCWRWHCRVMLAMALPWCDVAALSHADDEIAESRWRWRYRGDIGHAATSPGCTGYGKVV
jgi:hypothetical protein